MSRPTFPPPVCDACGFELTAPGALAFSPPASVSHASEVEKYHLCVECWGSHHVIVGDGAWTIEHPFECRLSGEMHRCPTHLAWERWVNGDVDPVPGRWRVLDFNEEGEPLMATERYNPRTATGSDR